MCQWGTTVTMPLAVPSQLSHSGMTYIKPVAVDACIAPLVRALNAGGIRTVASCCGHGKRPGRIALADGRELFIASTYEEAQQVDAAFPTPINPPPEVPGP